MSQKRFMAIHTFHSAKTKEAFFAMIAEDTSTKREWAKEWTFDKCRCVATWAGDDDFFFCHWLSETDEDIHNALRDTGLDNFVFTACYESQMHIDANFLSDAPAFPTSVSMNA